jgi:hypothetical protein
MHRRAWFLTALALGLVACAGSQRKSEPPPAPTPPTEPMAWVPADASVVARVALEPFRASSMWTLWSELEARSPAVTSFVDIALVDEVTLGGYIEEKPAGGSLPPPRFVAVLRGRFGAGYLAKLAASQGLVVKPRGLLQVVERPQEHWAQVSPELLLSFAPALAERMVARAAEGPDVAVRKGVLYQTLAKGVSFEAADLALLAEDKSGAGRAALREQGVPGRVNRMTEELVRGGLSIDMGKQIVVKVLAEAPDAAKAQSVQQLVTDTLDSLGSNMFVALFGLRPLVTAFKATSEGSFVHVEGSVPESDLEPVLRKLSTMIQLAAESGVAPAP